MAITWEDTSSGTPAASGPRMSSGLSSGSGSSGKSSGGSGSKSSGASSSPGATTNKLDDDEKLLKKLARAQMPQRTMTKPMLKRSSKR